MMSVDDEILMVIYWLQNEGFGFVSDPKVLQRFLNMDEEVLGQHLTLLVERSLVVHDGSAYRFSDEGQEEARRLFEDNTVR